MQLESSSPRIIIAIDGFSSCGKSTVAKKLAKELDYVYIDTGAMYRAITLYFLENNLDVNNQDHIQQALTSTEITFENVGKQKNTFLNGTDVEKDIRTMRVSDAVSEVSAISDIRKHIVGIQQKMGEQKGVVMEGRDIGTVVFPNAELKVFLTAQPEIRVSRRYKELLEKGKKVSRDEVRKNLEMRDLIDSTREHSPLRKAEDAWLIDNSDMTIQDQVDMIKRKINAINT